MSVNNAFLITAKLALVISCKSLAPESEHNFIKYADAIGAVHLNKEERKVQVLRTIPTYRTENGIYYIVKVERLLQEVSAENEDIYYEGLFAGYHFFSTWNKIKTECEIDTFAIPRNDCKIIRLDLDNKETHEKVSREIVKLEKLTKIDGRCIVYM